MSDEAILEVLRLRINELERQISQRFDELAMRIGDFDARAECEALWNHILADELAPIIEAVEPAVEDVIEAVTEVIEEVAPVDEPIEDDVVETVATEIAVDAIEDAIAAASSDELPAHTPLIARPLSSLRRGR